jgi:hypothetical protein
MKRLQQSVESELTRTSQANDDMQMLIEGYQAKIVI